ncbi:BZ3500_MvSof-1268-A1-R1_Chr9g10512 [Microbotryum saponariae]|uniref:BZ3500_MvSof-1268-A1-R1_Chr9g10512 protein n=1 Tax=Microbotryum saponariae TaxID=289078 RepID=A0A2X0L5T3_9BASI|nr:BZ3501_MvSof-1269-A2-R1_Chr9g10261 [Microbotryum saponariae]SDA00220.1 BZ3500_MvSof-1268-A1-R1_Chr9g10512 [Microbotryum saponariae]
MAPSSPQPTSFTSATDLLSSFQFERILSEDPKAHVAFLLGTAIPENTHARQPAIVKVEKTAFAPDELQRLATSSAWDKTDTVTCNSIYGTFSSWFAPGRASPDAQITSICPASEKHIRKYSQQMTRIVRETPELYEAVVEPYINSLDPNQISWVYNILNGTSEAEHVILRDEDPETGFVLTPDLYVVGAHPSDDQETWRLTPVSHGRRKWDKKTSTSLYLLVLVQTRAIRSLRDLRPHHLPLLTKIRRECERVAMERYGIDEGELRFFIHYQPTYYHFHIHVTHVSYLGFSGITVGQAHLLDDVIDLLTLEVSLPTPPKNSHYASRTFIYALGTEHALYSQLRDAIAAAPVQAADDQRPQLERGTSNLQAVHFAAAAAGVVS